MNNPTGAGNRQEGIVRADKIGCLILGKEYASKTFLVVKQEDGRVLLSPPSTVGWNNQAVAKANILVASHSMPTRMTTEFFAGWVGTRG